MHGRGGTKRHTFGCENDLATTATVNGDNMMEPPQAHSPAPSGGRTRRSGLLTVMERPPGN